MSSINLIFPHQLFEKSILLENDFPCFLVEEYLFFRQYAFHKQKIAFHRATMQSYKQYLLGLGKEVHYISNESLGSDVRNMSELFRAEKISSVYVLDPCDDWLMKRLALACEGMSLSVLDSPQFLNTREDLKDFFRSDKLTYFQTTFYTQQRKKRDVLLDSNGKPIGGKWTFDAENRKKYPRKQQPPSIIFPISSIYWDEALHYVDSRFSQNLGNLPQGRIYPIDHKEAKEWLQQFLDFRFHGFGDFEDAMVVGERWLHHSVLSPLLNSGLLTPEFVLDEAIIYAEKTEVPINSLEGFVRQIMGWREFIRGMYIAKGKESRTKNFWGFKRKIPATFYTGTTGVLPVDEVIRGILKTGYCHHIERLMVLGNFMLLCRFHPDEVYRWFMELFIDSYDWVMVPNVYGMCLFADGGLFATKPYISSSNYIKKMSNFPKGSWEEIWDGLFWTFMEDHSTFFRKNPRSGMLLNTLSKMPEKKRAMHRSAALDFLSKIDS